MAAVLGFVCTPPVLYVIALKGNKSSLVNQRPVHGYEYDLARPLSTNIYPGLVDHDAPVPQRQTGDRDPRWGCSELLELVQGFELKAIIRTRYASLWTTHTL